jgi:signal transduction histidine kinase
MLWMPLLCLAFCHGPAAATAETNAGDLVGLTVEDLYRRAVEQGPEDPRLSLEISKRALDRAIGPDDKEIRCRILSSMGNAHYVLGEYSAALGRYQESLVAARELGNLELSANALNNIGIIHYVWGEHDQALDYYLRAIALAIDQGNEDMLARGYNNVANIHQTAGRFAQALDYYEKALAIHLKLKNEKMVAAMHNNIGLLHYEMKQYEISRGHFGSALQIEAKINDRSGMALSLNNLGQVQEAEGQLDAALESYRKSLEIREELEDRQGVSVCLHNIGSVQMARKNFDEAIGYLEQALGLAEELHVQELIRDDLLGLSDAHALSGNHEQALAYHKRYKQAHDEIFDRERTRQMAMAETRFEVGLKDREIQALTREKEIERFRRQILLVVAALALGILVLMLNRYLFQKRAHREIRRANQALQDAHAELARASREELAHVARVATMGELAATFAHELNQPLAAIKVNARAGSNFLDRPDPDPSETLSAMEDIISDAERAQEIIVRLRRMMRKGQIKREELDLDRAALSAAGFLENEFRRSGVTLKMELDGDLPPVLGDYIQLQQVILNLLQNALAVTVDRAQGRVVLTTRVDGGQVTLEVSDNGRPVSDALMNELFEPFFTTKEDGLGMGLPICRTIIEAHDGRIVAYRNETTGLTFRIELPLPGRSSGP